MKQKPMKIKEVGLCGVYAARLAAEIGDTKDLIGGIMGGLLTSVPTQSLTDYVYCRSLNEKWVN
jgi:hypothetical protein